MQEEQVKRVGELMAQMATGDTSGAFTLYNEFGPVIRRVLRSLLADFNVNQVEQADLDALTLDAVMALLDAAPSWRPDGGAMPWTWAERRLRALVRDHIGIWADEFGDEHDGPDTGEVIVDDADELDSLERVARVNPTVQVLVEALEQCCSPRDRQVFLAVKAQAAIGDPSPSNTVAAQHGMTPPAVRKVVQRSREAVRALADRDDRFAALRDLALLA